MNLDMIIQLAFFYGQKEQLNKQEALTYDAMLRAIQSTCMLQDAHCLKAVREFDENPQGDKTTHLPGTT